jgi:hypothetical protein
VPDVAADAHEIALLLLPERSAALRTSEAARFARAGRARVGDVEARARQGGIGLVGWIWPRLDWGVDQHADQVGHLGHPHHVVRGSVVDRAPRHPGIERFLRILRDCRAPHLVDHPQAGRTVVERSREHNADHPLAVGACGAAEQRIQ